MNKIKNIVSVIIFVLLIVGTSVACILKPADEYSNSERRQLAQLPEISTEAITKGEFMEGFEEYSADQFPFRDKLRSIKAFFTTRVLQKLDNNGLFTADGHISKIDDAENDYMTDYAAKLFEKVYNQHLKNNKVYFSIVPDKNYVLAEENGYPSLDYEGFAKRMAKKMDFAEYIDIFPLLSADDYYTTDTHWRQESITDIAEHLANKMGTDAKADYTENALDLPFYGVYTGQYAMPVKPDTIKYLTNKTTDNCIVTYYDTGMPKAGDMYNMKKAQSKDPYEMFLSGVAPLITIENPDAKTDKELVMFRDSYGSSLAPLMAEGYKKITLVDLRYIQSGFLGNLVNFENCDVLFIYSTALLNNSLAMK